VLRLGLERQSPFSIEAWGKPTQAVEANVNIFDQMTDDEQKTIPLLRLSRTPSGQNLTSCRIGPATESDPKRRGSSAEMRKYRPFADGFANGSYRPRLCENSAEFSHTGGLRVFSSFEVDQKKKIPVPRSFAFSTTFYTASTLSRSSQSRGGGRLGAQKQSFIFPKTDASPNGCGPFPFQGSRIALARNHKSA
jgi:hypothetical protein